MTTRRQFLLGAGAACGCSALPANPGATGVFESDNPIHVICAGADSTTISHAASDFEPAPEALKVIQKMTQGLGLDIPFAVGKSDAPRGAYAQRIGDELVIVFSRHEYDFENGKFSIESMFVFAHELGHHIAHPQIRNNLGSTHAKERAADRFAGAAMCRFGFSLRDSLKWVNKTSKNGSKTHPPRAERIAAAKAGWLDAQSQLHWQNIAHCEEDWASDVLDINGKQCRLVRTCEASGPKTRLACQDDIGQWIWK